MKPEQFNQVYNECIGFGLANKGRSGKITDESFESSFNRAFQEIPQVKFLNNAQYLSNVVLPELANKRGTDSSSYKMYFEIFECLMYALKIIDRDQQLNVRLSNDKLLIEFYLKRILFYESELQKYTTMENLLFTETAKSITNKNLNNV